MSDVPAELVHYDNLELCEPGGAVDFFESGAPWRDGKTPVNVSGGIGTSRFAPVRIACKPEAVLLTLTSPS